MWIIAIGTAKDSRFAPKDANITDGDRRELIKMASARTNAPHKNTSCFILGMSQKKNG